MPGRGCAARRLSRRKGSGNTDEPLESTCYLRADRKNKTDPLRGCEQVPPIRETNGSCLPCWEGTGGDELKIGFAWRVLRFSMGRVGPAKDLTSWSSEAEFA